MSTFTMSFMTIHNIIARNRSIRVWESNKVILVDTSGFGHKRIIVLLEYIYRNKI